MNHRRLMIHKEIAAILVEHVNDSAAAMSWGVLTYPMVSVMLIELAQEGKGGLIDVTEWNKRLSQGRSKKFGASCDKALNKLITLNRLAGRML